MGKTLSIGGLSWAWQDEPEQWEVDDSGHLTVSAGPATRWFVDPADPSDAGMHAPALLAPVDGDFQLRASVQLLGDVAFDAGALVVYVHESAWAKLCLENSPARVPTVVSVVTRGVSDDCNALALRPGASISLRLARLGAAYALHASHDGQSWELIRYFSLESPEAVLVGFQAQSPRGDGARVRFGDIALIRERLGNIRSGE